MKFGFLLVAMLYLAGCGSIINGTTQKIPVTADPMNASVTAIGGDITITDKAPCTLNLKRKHNQVVTVSATGYKPQTVQLQSVVSGAVAGNILLGGLIGWGVDAASGGDSKLVPEVVSVVLEPEEVVAKADPGPTNEKAGALEADLSRLDGMLSKGAITQDEHSMLRQKTLEKY
jgi:hypothetical protein